MMHKIKIAVSACLLGQRVRYDGREKTHALIVDFFLKQCSDQVEIVPFCPEVAIGLSVPRAKIQVVKRKDEQTRVLGVENHRLDVTEPLKSYAETFLQQYPDIRYFIVKSKSPSCGFQSTPLFELSGFELPEFELPEFEFPAQEKQDYKQIGLTSGLFVQTLLLLNPEVQIIEEARLTSREACSDLIKLKNNKN